MGTKCVMCQTEGELVNAIAKDEIIEVCKNCADKNDLPIIQKPTQEQVNRSSRFLPIHNRIAFSIETPGVKQKIETTTTNKELEKMVIQNSTKKDYSDLVDNFHWHIQQARRFKKISQKQLSELIGEPEVLISMAEEGKLPEDYDKLISKLEQYFRIQLRKESKKQEAFTGFFDLKKADLNVVMTGDLKNAHEEMVIDEVKQKIEENKKKGFWSRFFGSDDGLEEVGDSSGENADDLADIEEAEEEK